MDPELIAYLDERFRGIDQRFQGIDQQFQGIDEQFRESSQQISQRFDKLDKRLDQMDEQLRLTDVRVEGLQSQIQVVAEGVAAGNETLDSFKTDVAKEFSDTRDLIKDGYKELDKRVKVLERRARIS